jgi:hypothetical protein
MAGKNLFRLLSLLSLLLFFLGAGSFFFGDRFRVVVPGRVYRSGQFPPEKLEEKIDRHGIRTILNLRGEKDDRDWYRREVALADRLGVVHRSLDLLPDRLPPRPALVALIDYLETVPEPILIHCAAGVDRTGFASVVARLRSGASLAQAREELGLRHGRVPFGPSAEIGRIFDGYEDYLRESKAEGSWAAFEHWARDVYVPYVYRARLEPLTLPSAASARERMDVRLRVTNESPGPWVFEAAADRGIKLGVRLRAPGSAFYLDYDRHAPARGALAPGGRIELAVAIWAPEQPGEYELKLDMVDEHVTWFEDQGSPPLLWRLSVHAAEPLPSGEAQKALELPSQPLAQARLRTLSREADPMREAAPRRVVFSHVPLADESRVISGVFETRREGREPMAHLARIVVGPDLVRARVAPGEKARAGGRAQGCGHESVPEPRPLLGEPVDAGVPDERMARGLERVPPEIVGENHHEVGAAPALRRGGRDGEDGGKARAEDERRARGKPESRLHGFPLRTKEDFERAAAFCGVQ